MTGRLNSATTSRKMWMLSASSTRRWSSRETVEGTSIVAELGISTPKIQKPGRWVPGFSIFSALFSGCPSVEQQDREHGDELVPTTTTCARAHLCHEPRNGTSSCLDGQAGCRE